MHSEITGSPDELPNEPRLNKRQEIADDYGDDDPTTVVEYVEFNILGAYVGERTPIFVDVV